MRTVSGTVCGTMLFLTWLLACTHVGGATGPGPGGSKNVRGLSPGPAGGLIEDDYRNDVLYINEPGEFGPGDYARWIKHQGRDRFYQFHVPASYKKGTPIPVVMVLHGGGGNPGNARFESGMDPVADKNGFIALYPAGSSPQFKDRLLYFNNGLKPKDDRQKDVDDVAFIAAVIDDITRFFSIDAKRVYACGISNGAQMSWRLGTQLSDRIAAIGPVAAQRYVGELYPAPPRPISVIYFHGKKDEWRPYDGGPTFKSAFEDSDFKTAPESVKTWLKHDGCDEAAVETANKGAAHMQRWAKCQGGAEFVFWTLDDGGHTWPGGKATKFETRGGIGPNKKSVGPINKDINASQLMWEFFQRHPLP